MSEETGFLMEKRPPARLAKLERRKKRRRPLTEEDIKQKLEKANERRKVRGVLIVCISAHLYCSQQCKFFKFLSVAVVWVFTFD